MYKASIEILKLTKMIVKFSTVIDEDKISEDKYGKVINKFTMDGNNYLKISPRSYVTIDISNKKQKKEDGWDANSQVSLNRLSFFQFKYHLQNFVRNYKNYKNLYYYNSNHELLLNKESASQVKEIFSVGGKMINLMPVVVPDLNNDGGEPTEGCVLCINSFANFCFIPYEEMEYLNDELHAFDFISSSLLLISIAEKHRDMEAKDLAKNLKVITEKEEEIIDKDKIIVKIEKPNEIPDI